MNTVKNSLAASGAVVMCCLGMLTMCGCYKRVVRVEGDPGGQYEVHEPNLKPGLFEPSEPQGKSLSNKTAPSKKAP